MKQKQNKLSNSSITCELLVKPNSNDSRQSHVYGTNLGEKERIFPPGAEPLFDRRQLQVLLDGSRVSSIRRSEHKFDCSNMIAILKLATLLPSTFSRPSVMKDSAFPGLHLVCSYSTCTHSGAFKTRRELDLGPQKRSLSQACRQLRNRDWV